MNLIPQDMFAKLKRSLIKHEGRENFAYIDTMGNLTIGIGYNLSIRGLSDAWIDDTFLTDCVYFYRLLLHDFSFFRSINEDRQIVLVDMAFMGYKKLLEFEKMFAALEKQDYKAAAQEMLNSEWAAQVKGRAIELAEAMERGIYDV